VCFPIPLLLPLLFQSTIYVPDDYPTIQSALWAAQAGDSIVVRTGTWNESGITFSGKAVTVVSEDGPAATIVDAGGADAVFVFDGGETSASILDGFTITNGSRWDGGGLDIHADANGNSSSPTIRNCIITGNVGVGGGGGVSIGGGSTSLFENVLIQGNSTTYYDGAGMNCWASFPTFVNVTIRENQAGRNGGGIITSSGPSSLTGTNCIIYDNGPNNLRYGATTTLDFEYSCVANSSTYSWFGTGCIDQDPLIVSGSLGDVYLSQIAAGQGVDSPCVDAGDPASTPSGTTRTDHLEDTGVVDMGFHLPASQPGLEIVNLVAGQVVNVTLSNCTPGGTAILAYSLRGGGPITTLFGQVFLTPPYSTFSLTVDATGHATLSSQVPPNVAGYPVWFHAGDLTLGALTNPLAMVIG
jgi:hypothetical protein